jgi:hypothetical protein
MPIFTYPPAHISSPLLAVTASDQNVSSSTYAASIGVSLVASATYQLELWVPYSYSAGTPGIKVRLTAVAGLTVTSMRVAGQVDAEGSMQPSVTALATDIVAGAAGTGLRTAHILGSMTVNAAGVIVPQWAQNTTDGSNPLTIYRGAYLKLVRINLI